MGNARLAFFVEDVDVSARNWFTLCEAEMPDLDRRSLQPNKVERPCGPLNARHRVRGGEAA